MPWEYLFNLSGGSLGSQGKALPPHPARAQFFVAGLAGQVQSSYGLADVGDKI